MHIPVQPNNPKHRAPAGRQHECKRSSQLEGGVELDLSVHRPGQPGGNRVDILRPLTPPPPPPCSQDRQSTSLERRDRRIRDSREMRRRRDAKRARRNAQAVQALDEQLSRDIDRTLQQAIIQRHLPTKLPTPIATADPRLSKRSSPSPQRNSTPPIPARPKQALPSPQPTPEPQTPLRLPLLNFGGLDLMDNCPSVRSSPSPRLPSPVLPLLPSWCPALPALTNNLKLGEFPTFFNLSHLPEKAVTSTAGPRRQEVQVWRPAPSKIPRKVSHHLPQPPLSKPSDKTVVNRSKLHASDMGSQDMLQEKEIVPPQKQPDLLTGEQYNEASAANLWRILLSSEKLLPNENAQEDYLNSCTYRPTAPMLGAPYGIDDYRLEAVGTPVELDATAIPFVHANSLTGHANERGSETIPALDSGVFIYDTALYGPVEEFMFGLNEYVMDQDYAQHALDPIPPLPPSPIPVPMDGGSLESNVQSEDTVIQTNEVAPSDSDAQYNSECALFDLTTAAEVLVDEDLVDVATFLTSAHGSDCWCDECECSWPESNDSPSPTYEDPWLEYVSSLPRRSPATKSEWDWAEEPVVSNEERDVSRTRCAAQPSWEDFFPCRPSSLAHRAW